MKIVTTITDPNHPNFGQVIETDIADPEKPFNGSDEFAASIKRKADKLARKGDKAAASYLLSKHGL